jgi:hypothetical protein
MLKHEGQGDEGNFIGGEILETEEIQAIRAGDGPVTPLGCDHVSAEAP